MHTNEKATQLSISTDVLEKIATIATKEVAGVASISKRAVDLRGTVKNKSAFKGVKAESVNGAIVMNVFVTLKQGAKVNEVAEAVQKNVKERIQSMTGAAVTRVNVTVADIEFEEEKKNDK